jgi:selenocysteine-specific elongation factor
MQPQRVLIATAGHVDHGKTSLVKALTGVDTDRLAEEKRRGISIELGFAELPGAELSFIDVPGHEKLLHAMIAGAFGVSAVLLVVAADDGVMPQTREHAYVCKALGVDRVIVALTKADLVDGEMLELARADALSLVDRVGLKLQSVVAVSSATGAGLSELRTALEGLRRTHGASPASGRTWLSVDRVFSLRGVGTVVTGSLVRGSLRAGAAVQMVGGTARVATHCRGLHVHGRAVDAVDAPNRVAVNLARVETADVQRGFVLTTDTALPQATSLDVAITWFPGSTSAGQQAVVAHVGTARAAARLTLLTPGIAHLQLERPLPCEGGAGIVIRGGAPSREHGRVLGGGRVLDAMPSALPRRRSAHFHSRVQILEQLASGSTTAALLGYLQTASPRPISAADLERRLGLEPGAVACALASKRKPLATAISADTWVDTGALTALQARAVEELERLHAAAPAASGVSMQTLRSVLERCAGGELAELVIERACKAGTIVLMPAGLIATTRFLRENGPAAKERSRRLLDLLERAAHEGRPEDELARELREPLPAVRSALAQLATSGRARRLSDLWFAETALEGLRQTVRAYFTDERRLMSVPAFKELVGVSRKQAIPLLEQFDREGTTRRVGDDRVLGAAAAKGYAS